MQCVLKNGLGLKPLELTDIKKKVRLERAKELLRLHESGQLPNLVFSDEQPFQTEQFMNKQNDWVDLPKRSVGNLHLRLATKIQAPPLISFLPYNGHQNLQILIIWTFATEAF